MQYINEVEDVLQQENWQWVNRRLTAKMLSEYMYEDMIFPREISQKGRRIYYCLTLSKDIEYIFEGEKRLFDSYHVFPDTIQYKNCNEVEDVRAVQFLLDITKELEMTPETTSHLIKELNHTLIADAHMAIHAVTSDELVDMDYAKLEGEMTGHPWITYNKGRIGFDYEDYLSYAPENKKEISLSWLAVHRDWVSFHSVDGLDYREMIRHELDLNILESFKMVLKGKDIDDIDAYFFMPIHEWQWQNVVIPLFADELAADVIIPLGKGPDKYLPQQSIRTFVNLSNEERYHVKLPISILNTLVYRGLPAERTVIAPKVTQYIQGIRDNDAFLRDECQLITPGEVASINYDHPDYSKLQGAPYQYLEMLGCIWRENIYSYIKEGEHPVTLAALLHIDRNGKPLISSWVERSGLTLKEWLARLFHVTLPPLLHYLYQYGTVFSPHGQNTILVLKDAQPHRLAMKDYVDDVNISDQPFPELETLSKNLKDVLRSEPPEGLTQFVFTGLFICHFRYLSDLLEVHHDYSELMFWRQVREEIVRYQKRFPELEERFRLFDLLKPDFTKLCLNRNRMVDYGYNNDKERPHASEYGKVNNALYTVT